MKYVYAVYEQFGRGVRSYWATFSTKQLAKDYVKEVRKGYAFIQREKVSKEDYAYYVSKEQQ